MKNYLNKKHPLVFISVIFIICFIVRICDSFFLRMDQTNVIGSLIVHKIFGICLLGFVLYKIKIKWSSIGFGRDILQKNIFTGFILGSGVFLIAYFVEYIIESINGNYPSLVFYVSSFNILGNTELNGGLIIVVICILDNIINVVMEEGVFRGLFLYISDEKYSFIKSAFIASFLFGIWHFVMPVRNYIDGLQSFIGMAMNILLLVSTSFLFGIVLCLLYKITGSIWAGMTVHFVNNTSINLLHIVAINGTDKYLTMRITIAQTLLTIIIICVFIINEKKNKCSPTFT